MGSFISIGQFNKYYFFILGSILVKLLNTFITGFFPSLTPNNPVFLLGFQPSFLSHPFIKYTFQYLGIGLGGLISHYIFYKRNKDVGKKFKEEKNFQNEENNSQDELKESQDIDNDNDNSKSLITKSRFNSAFTFNNNDISFKNEKSYLKTAFIVFILYYFSKVSISSLDSLGFHQTKLWTFEFIPVYILSQKMLNIKIYKHQKFSLSTTLIFTTLLYFINSFVPESNEICENEEDKCGFIQFNVYQKIINKLYWFFIPIIFIIYFLAMASNAYASVRNKWFMDIKYILIFKIITFIGIIGFIFSLIILFITSFISCNKDKMKYICFFNYDGKLYYENFRSLNIEIDYNFFLEIFILIPLYLISNFFSVYFDLLIINYLDPFYLVPIDTCYYIIYETIDFFITLSITNFYSNIRFCLAISSDLISIICCSVYLEIVELHFCGLDVNIKKNIMKRADNDRKAAELEKRNDNDNVNGNNNNNNNIENTSN